MGLNRLSLDRLIENHKNDPELLEAIQDALKSFEEYHIAIYSMETRKKLLIGTVEAMGFQAEIMTMDQKRTSCHNAVLANVALPASMWVGGDTRFYMLGCNLRKFSSGG